MDIFEKILIGLTIVAVIVCGIAVKDAVKLNKEINIYLKGAK